MAFYHIAAASVAALMSVNDNLIGEMVGRARLERATNWLKANCSTN